MLVHRSKRTKFQDATAVATEAVSTQKQMEAPEPQQTQEQTQLPTLRELEIRHGVIQDNSRPLYATKLTVEQDKIAAELGRERRQRLLEKFLEEKARDQRRQWTAEFIKAEDERVQQLKAAEETAARLKLIDENNKRIAEENQNLWKSPADKVKVKCSCGEYIVDGAVAHVMGDGMTKHIRSPYQAKLNGLINKAAWSELTSKQKNEGYFVHLGDVTTAFSSKESNIVNPVTGKVGFSDPSVRVNPVLKY